MILAEILENAAISVVKTVWQKRGGKVTRREVSRLLATGKDSQPQEKPNGG